MGEEAGGLGATFKAALLYRGNDCGISKVAPLRLAICSLGGLDLVVEFFSLEKKSGATMRSALLIQDFCSFRSCPDALGSKSPTQFLDSWSPLKKIPTIEPGEVKVPVFRAVDCSSEQDQSILFTEAVGSDQLPN